MGRVQSALIYLLAALGEVQAELGQDAAALAIAQQVEAAACRAGLPFEQAVALRVRGRALAQRGEPEAAAAALSQSAALLTEIGATVALGLTLPLLSGSDPQQPRSAQEEQK